VRIGLIGTRGVPARYGGFETAVEEIGRRLADGGHEVVVYCRNDEQRRGWYRGMQLVHLPALHRPVLETLSHTALSSVHALFADLDAAVVFNAANAPLLPVLRAGGLAVAVHVDGMEWRRQKWGIAGRRYYLVAERLAVKWGDALIADARGIQDYYRSKYGVDADFIPYGAPLLTDRRTDRLQELDLQPQSYHLVVARLEPENHVHTIIEGYTRSAAALPLIVVGGASYSHAYVDTVEVAAAQDPRVRLIGGVWDSELLNQLYGGALTYLHGHSVGGTNPSLLRAMGAGTKVIANDVVFNHEVLGPDGTYFCGPPDLSKAIAAAERDRERSEQLGAAGQDRLARLYDWDDVALSYEQLCGRLQLLHRRRRSYMATGAVGVLLPHPAEPSSQRAAAEVPVG
jgi:glycosyltransferase involved in cell wall biosynthesis